MLDSQIGPFLHKLSELLECRDLTAYVFEEFLADILGSTFHVVCVADLIESSLPLFFGHSCQAIAIVAGCLESFFAIPLVSRIHEGLIFSNRDKRTLPGKMIALLETLCIEQPCYFVADAYYACKATIRQLLQSGKDHLVSLVRSNAVAYFPAPRPRIKRRGAPRKYGKKIKLRTLFHDIDEMESAQSPIYGERGVLLRYRVIDLYWRPVGILVRFVAVMHPNRGRKILMSTDCSPPKNARLPLSCASRHRCPRTASIPIFDLFATNGKNICVYLQFYCGQKSLVGIYSGNKQKGPVELSTEPKIFIR